jgi:hypothetical protein
LQKDPDTVPKLFGFDLNRVIAFLGPHIAWLSGVIATWLMAQTDLFATFDVSDESLAGAISQALVFGVVTLVVWLGQHKWLDGFQKWAYEAFEGFGENNEPYVVTADEGEQPPDDSAMAGFREGDPPVAG